MRTVLALALLLGLTTRAEAAYIEFHNPMFAPIYIDSESIVAVTPGDGFCAKPLTRLDLNGTTYCVIESIEHVLKKLNDAAKEAEE